MPQQFTPELGQYTSGQTFHEYEAPGHLITALDIIEEAMEGAGLIEYEKYKNRKAPLSPFRNTGASFKNHTFEVEAYSWDDDYQQPYNFKWADLEVSWYKYLPRGVATNRPVSFNEVSKMVKECVASLSTEDAGKE